MNQMPALLVAITALSALSGCSTAITDEEAAERADLGVDPAVELALQLGLDGYNAATSANIPNQDASGAASGSIVVGGQVDQGSSDNKQLRLDVWLNDWSNGVLDDDDDFDVSYATDAPLLLDISLRGLPDADLEGSLIGDVMLDGELDGPLTLELVFDGQTETDPDDPSRIRRVPGSTHVTGTATVGRGVYDIDLTR